MKLLILLLTLWIVGNDACYAQNLSDTLVDGLRDFGRGEYGSASQTLEVYAKKHPDQAPYLYYYIGECYFQTNDLVKARECFQQAFTTLFNKDEAAERLSTIFEKQGQMAKADPYRAYKAKQLEKFKDWLPDPQWDNTQPRGARDPDEPLRLFGTRDNPDYQRGRLYLADGYPSQAVFCLERAVVVGLPFSQRFNTGQALQDYTKLAKAYRQKALLFREKQFNLNEVPEAEKLAEHYRLKAIIVEAHLATNNSKSDKQP